MGTTAGSRETDPFQVRALTRGLSILCLFDVDHRDWTIDEMAEQTGLVRMTVYRMVRTLESMAFLVRDTATNRYRLGPATLAMTYVSDDQSDFVEAARPFLESLVEETGESVTLAVEVDGFPVCVDIINTTRPFRRQDRPRTDPRRHRHGPRQDLRRLQVPGRTERHPHTELSSVAPRTPSPIRSTLAEELDRIAKDNVAFDLEGLYLGICAVGAPVRDQLGSSDSHYLGRGPVGALRPGRQCAVHRGGQGHGSLFLGLPGLDSERAAQMSKIVVPMPVRANGLRAWRRPGPLIIAGR